MSLQKSALGEFRSHWGSFCSTLTITNELKVMNEIQSNQCCHLIHYSSCGPVLPLAQLQGCWWDPWNAASSWLITEGEKRG